MKNNIVPILSTKLVVLALVGIIFIIAFVPSAIKEYSLTEAQESIDQLILILVMAFIALYIAIVFIFNKTIKVRLRTLIFPLKNQKIAMDAHSLVSMTDLKGNITFVNDKFIKVSGYNEAELLGKNHNLLNSNNHPKSYWQNMYLTVSQGETWHDQVRNRAKDGHYYWVDTTIVPNYDEKNQLIGYTSIRTDISEQKENLVQLALAKEQAEVASVSKADFLANMSHEIRTPMNGVIGMNNLLLASELNTEQLKLAKTVKSSAVSLLAIINDILDFSKVEAGKLELELIPFDLGNMLEDLGATMNFQAEAKGLQLICPANPLIKQWVKADPGRIRQILTNLIGNAIKFTEQGEVAVYVQVIEQTAHQKVLRFDVKDTGIGISESQQQHLFTQFSQADSSTTRKYGGTGLGLSICKKLVELMQGEIGIDSEVANGTTFWFTLTLANAKAVNEAPTYNTDIQNEKILIVDDNETNRMLMHQLHKIWAIPHSVTTNAKTALVELAQAAQHNSPYTIAILDMHMPEMDGIELCQRIQADAQLKGIKMIMVSSHAQSGDGAKVKAAGFHGYLSKPIQQSELFDILLMVSGLKEKSPQLITRHSAKEHAQFKGHLLVVEDNATNQLVIEGLLKALGLTVDLAANGEEAISALKRGNVHDLVFMDCQMPVMDGYTATAKIRDPQTGLENPLIPIIAMTANAMAGDKQKCLDAGMDDYLAKPVNPVKVQAMLKQWLPNTNPKKTVTTSLANTVTKTTSDILIFDYDDMAKRLMHKPDLMRSVAEMFCQDLVEQINDIKINITQNNIEQVEAIAHKIKGASANVGGLALSALALEIELASKAGKIDTVNNNINDLELAFSHLKTEMGQKINDMAHC
ncbi:hypothetical protein A9Q74_00125 [Colwellia sp. 39_35_sub15_T18]|nr:hypothetical protein A9Q74_00125 [Colwellia sp. 39_35_sub15_T18]